MATVIAWFKEENKGFSTNINGNINFSHDYAVEITDIEGFVYPDDLINATGLPKQGEFKGDTNSRVTTIDFTQQDDNNRFYTATVNYESLQVNLPDSSFTEDKNRIVSLSFGANVYNETIDSAYIVDTVKKGDNILKFAFDNIKESENDDPVQNTAKDKIIGVTEPRYNLVMHLTQVEDSSFDPEEATQLLGYPNTDPITIAGIKFEAQEGLITRMTPQLKNPNSSSLGFPSGRYYETTYEIERRKGGWYQRVLNDGFRQIVDNKLVEIINSDVGIEKNPNDKISDPAKLDNVGKVITNDDVYYQVIWAKYPKKWGNVVDFVSEVS